MHRHRISVRARGQALLLFVSLLTLTFLLTFSIRASESEPPPRVWFVDNNLLRGIDTATNQVPVTISLQSAARSLAVDSTDRSVWALRNANLLKFSESGTQLLNINLRAVSSLDHPWSLVLNPYDRSVWVASENSISHFSAEGANLLDWESPGNIQALVLNLDGGAWILTKAQLLELSPTGAVVANADLHPYVINPGYLAIDGLGGIAWVAAYSHLIRLDTNNLAQPASAVALPPLPDGSTHKIEALAVHPVFGTLWTVSRDVLYLHDRQGMLLGAVDLAPYGLGLIRSIAYDPRSLSLWLGGTTAIGRFSNTGEFVTKLPLQKAATAIGTAPFELRPTLSVIDPPENALTSNPRPTIRLGLGASCSAAPCILPDPYINSLTLDVALNGLAVGSFFTIAGGEARYTPASPLPDGLNTFTATATDLFGNPSESVSSQFTVDTVAPQFTALSPADGSTFATGAVSIAGQVDDPNATVILSDATGTEVSAGGANFSFAILLQQGLNTFTLTAQDSAGNATTVPLRLSYLVPLNLSIQSPIDGATVTTETVTVSGTIEGPSGTTVTVNGEAATLSGATFTIDVALNQGSNTLAVLATAPDGRTQSAAATVTRESAAPPDPIDGVRPLDPTVATTLLRATSFLYSGANPIQQGVAPETMDAKRVAIVRGRVITRDGSPLADVTVTVLNHPEFGYTKSRASGMFDLAVNGGRWLTINYTKDGYLLAQRQINAPWQNYVFAEEVALVPIDNEVTTVHASAATIQIARGSVSADADGVRRATLLFMPGTTATMTLPNGTTEPLTTLSVRATEYTLGQNGPKAMPAPLPPSSGYTYAVELSVDEAIAVGAKTVQFNQPVYQYVENFLDFPVGQIVPAGYYDRDKAAWIPSANGRVIRVLDASGAMAELDTNGDEEPDTAEELALLNITDAERAELARLYSANVSLWRIPVTHFTPWDYNWPYGPPDDAADPEQPEPENDDPDDNQCPEVGSIIQCQSQTLGERVPIVGTPFALHYQSDRVPGRKVARSIKVRLSGPTTPASLRSIVLVVEIAGRQFRQSFPAAPNQSYVFTWDGLDAYGRAVNGSQVATIKLGYVYQLVYYQPALFEQSFARLSGRTAQLSRASQQVTLWQYWLQTIGSPNLRGEGLGAWSISTHHRYDPNNQDLHLGTGERRSGEAQIPVIVHVAGTGGCCSSFDGQPATQSRLSRPERLAVGPDGSLYISDNGNHRVYRVWPNGIMTTAAGSQNRGFGGDGGPANQAMLNNPHGIAVAPDGSLYIADTSNQRIRRVSPSGIITTIAGTGAFEFWGDGGPATQAALRNPDGVAVAADGTVYFADTRNHRIRQISLDGVITTVAGNGVFGFGGDGGPATQARLNNPAGVALNADGNLYIADTNNNRIRRVSPSGIITTIAGNGDWDFNGDGEPPLEASFRDPIGVVVAPDNSLYVVDRTNSRIRRVSPSNVTTVLVGGSSLPGGTPDYIGSPRGIAFDPDGSMYFTDTWYRVHKLSASSGQFALHETLVPSADGRELYSFTLEGRHKHTFHSATGATVFSFGYDSEGQLVTITDGDSNITRIERDASGVPTAVVAPDGQRTTLSLDSNGYLAGITNPANETYAMTYTADGLLTSFTNPRGHTSQFIYDADGRLTRDENAAAGSWTLARTTTGDDYAVTKTSALNRTTTYRVDNLSTGDRQWRNTAPDGTETQTLFKTDGTTITTTADGTTTTTVEGPEPRFGMQAPIQKDVTIETPSGLTQQITKSRSVTLADPNDFLSLQTQTDTLVHNGKTTTTVFDAASRLYTTTTPLGRQVSTTVDDQNRPIVNTVTGLDPVTYGYDQRGRLTSVTQSSGEDTRRATLAYNAEGFIEFIVDPENRTQSFTYDGAGRVKTQTLPDGRVITWSYDANGNIIGITPPGRPQHTFTYTPVDLEAQYTPPVVTGVGAPQTQYAYNLDKQLTTITRPDGQVVELGYDSGGRLSAVTTPRRTATYGYHPTTGRLSNINTDDGQSLSYAYDGFLPVSATWSGLVTGTVARSYSNDFLVSGVSVNATNVSFAYDNDNLLTQAGSLAISRDPQNGLITATTLGVTVTTQTHNAFGEIVEFGVIQSSNSVYNASYARDKLGRITEKTETIEGQTDTYGYVYDSAGRVEVVTKNGVTDSSYIYNANGNRLSQRKGVLTIDATYDDQDRLLTYGNNTYSYTPNGELRTKIDGAGTTTYTYDFLGNLTNVVLPDGSSIEYVTDGRNRRVGKKVDGTFVQAFLYQDRLRPVAELDTNGNVVSRFVYGSRFNVPDYLIRGGTEYRIVSDHLGSPRLVVNTVNGDIVQRLDYDEFGNVIYDSNPGFQPFGFAGGLYDPDIHLVRFGARDYDPETGRWTAKDPIRFGGRDTNLYGYAFNDPVNVIDTDGRVAFAVPLIPPVLQGIGSALTTLGIGVGITTILSGDTPQNQSGNVPPLPTDLVGENAEPSSGKRTNTDLPADRFPDVVEDLTGGNLGEDGGQLVCPNGVRVRPPRADRGKGPRIEIPANGAKPHETIHFPPNTPWPW